MPRRVSAHVPTRLTLLLFPPLKKGGRGDLLLLLPMSHATSLLAGKSKSPLAPFFKGGKR